jgi:hypothetical protein
MEDNNRTLWWALGGLALVVIVLVGCIVVYLMLQQQMTAEPTLDVDAIVEQTMSAIETLTPATDTPPPPPEPSATLTLRPTLTPTTIPSPTQTRTPFPTASPTLNPEDPTLILGPPTWQDEFKSDTNWTLFDDACFKSEIEDEKFIMTAQTVPSATCWEVTWPRIADFYLETTAISTDACSGTDRFGLIFRAPDPSQGYLFGLTCDGRYTMARWDPEDSEWDSLIEFTESDRINAGPNQTNRIGVMAQDDLYGLYINGYLVDEMVDDFFTESGLFGFVIGASETQGFQIQYDEIGYWDVE